MFTAVPLVALYWAPIDALSIAYILAACAAFSLPGFLVRWPPLLKRNSELAPSRQALFVSPQLRRWFVASVLCSLVFTTIDLGIQGFAVSDMFENFYATSNELFARRNGGQLQANLFGRSGFVLAYVAAILGGLIQATLRARRIRAGTIGLALAPSLVIMLISGAKGTFTLAIAVIFGSTWLYRVMSDERPYIDVRSTLYQARYVALGLPFLMVAFLQRGLYASRDTNIADKMLSNFGSYTFMHIYAWSDWFSWTTRQQSAQTYTEEQVSVGYLTFKVLFDAAGRSQKLPVGLYSEYYRLDDGLSTNIYTIFRGLVTDFGLLGSLAVIMGLGFLFTYAFSVVLTRRIPLGSIFLLLVFVQVAYSSWLASALVWNTTLFAPMVSVAIIALSAHRVRNGH